MFTEANKGFTIITNFGCGNNCSYCISKHHPILQNKKTNKNNLDWTYLEQCIKETNSPKVNLSGGGDPFFNYNNNIDFYERVYEICQKYNKLMDIHTRILPDNNDILNMFNKIALSIEFDDVNKIKYISTLINKYPKLNLRAIHVVNERMNVDDCLTYIETIKSIGIKQVTFRQMFGNKRAYENYEVLKNQMPKQLGVLFLDDGEYHSYYFTTNNKLYPYFFGYTEEDRIKWMKIYENIEQSCA
jgi:organic radical activating enzyme